MICRRQADIRDRIFHLKKLCSGTDGSTTQLAPLLSSLPDVVLFGFGGVPGFKPVALPWSRASRKPWIHSVSAT
jgi:hypothetical protein